MIYSVTDKSFATLRDIIRDVQLRHCEPALALL